MTLVAPNGSSTDQKQPLERRRRKFRIRFAFAAATAATALVVLAAASSLIGSLTRSEQTNAVFSEAASLPPDLIGSVVWAPDPGDLPRQMEPLTREAVASSWLRAWEQLRIVAETGDTSGVEVYFSDPARSSILEASDWHGRSLRQLGHDLALTFYSDDGQVIGLSSTATRLLRTERNGDERWQQESTEQYEVVMVLEDGNWRIHHLVRRSVDASPWVLAKE